jgi:hypothetical protein
VPDDQPTVEQVQEILDRIPGALERTRQGVSQARRGEGIPLDELVDWSPTPAEQE